VLSEEVVLGENSLFETEERRRGESQRKEDVLSPEKMK
jgi:hypothetical protein